MRLSKAAKNKWLAACLFSATVLTGFQLQQMNAQASHTQTTTVTSTPSNGSGSGNVAGSFATHTSTVTLSSTSTSTTSTSTDVNSSSASSTSSASTSTTSSTNTGSSSTGSSRIDSSGPAKSNTDSSSSSSTSSTPNHNPDKGSSVPDADNEKMGHLEVNALNGLTNTPIAGDKFTGEYQGYVGTAVKDKSALITHIVGYSYVGDVNTDIPDNFEKGTQTANLVYMPLSTIVVHYVDVNDPSKILWTYSIPTNFATDGQSYSTDDNLIQFAGYKFDHASDNTTGTIGQTVKSLEDANSINVNYYYEQEPGQTSTLDTSNWVVTSETTPIGLTGKYGFSVYLQRDKLPAVKLGGYETGKPDSGHGQTKPAGNNNQSGSGHAHTNGGSGSSINNKPTDSNTPVNENSTSVTTVTPSMPLSAANTPVAEPTATVNVVNETGNPVTQLTVSGQPGTNVRTQIQPKLSELRKNGFAILSSGVKGNTFLGATNSVTIIKVSHPQHQANPFQHNTMPIVTQLGNASQAASQTTNTANSSSTNSKQSSDSNSNSQPNQNNAQQKQQITQNKNATQATSKDTEQNSQANHNAIANNGQSLQQSAADNGSGGTPVSGLAAYFISLSGKINLGTRA